MNGTLAGHTIAAAAAGGAGVIRIGHLLHPASAMLDINLVVCTGPSTMVFKQAILEDATWVGDGIHPCFTGHKTIADAVRQMPAFIGFMAGSQFPI